MKNISTILLLFLAIIGHCQETSINTTAVPFLIINSDARAGAMGDVGVATNSDVFSIYHNPAKTVFNKNKINFGLNYTPWMRNLTNDIFIGSGSFINTIRDNAAWGIDVKYFSLGKIQLSDDSGSLTGTENPQEFAITGVYSLKLSNEFSMGVGLKYFNSNYKIKSTNSNLDVVNGFAVDVSGYYESDEKVFGTFMGRYRFGFNIANIGPKIEYVAGIENFIPTIGKIGGGFDFIFDEYNSVGINLEFTKLLVPSSQKSQKGWFGGMFSSLADRSFSEELKETTLGLGIEYVYNTNFALRTGYFNDTKGNIQFLTLGAGFKTGKLAIDLSYLANTSKISNNPLENTLRFSLSFNFSDNDNYVD